MKKLYLLPLLAIAACSAPHKASQTGTTSNSSVVLDGKLWASVFQQKAAEYKALCFQAYNIAQLRLQQALQQPSAKPLAVVTDIDETLLDNSPNAVHQVLQGKDYETKAWMEWTARAEADTLAGARTFFNYAAANKVEVFYITNRDEQEKAATILNLKKFGFPYADDAHVIMRQPNTSSSKESRRQNVSATHNIVLLLGDNLGDFSMLFDKKTSTERVQNVQSNAAEFGKRFIVLPNVTYGDWESSMYQYNYKLTNAQKDSAAKSGLRNY